METIRQKERNEKTEQNQKAEQKNSPKNCYPTPFVQHSPSVHGIAAHAVVFASPISTLPLPTHVWCVHIKAEDVFGGVGNERGKSHNCRRQHHKKKSKQVEKHIAIKQRASNAQKPLFLSDDGNGEKKKHFNKRN